MRRIESVKEVLPESPSDEAPFSVIKAYRDKRRPGEKMPVEHRTTKHSLIKNPIPQEIKHKDKPETSAPVIGVKKQRGAKKPQ